LTTEFFKKAGHEVKNNLSVTDYNSENIRQDWSDLRSILKQYCWSDSTYYKWWVLTIE